MKAQFPHDHETFHKAAEMFRESQQLVQQKEANKRKTRSSYRKKTQTQHVAPAAKKAVMQTMPAR